MEIRIAANESDSRAASAIYAMSWKCGYRGLFSDSLLDGIPLDFLVGAFNGNYETHRFAVAILRANGKDVVAGGYGLSRDYDDPACGEITSIYFLEEAWGKGYARLLMDFMIEKLKSAGCTKIHVWALRDNSRARRFYEKYGFTLSGNEKTVSFKGEEKMDVEYVLR